MKRIFVILFGLMVFAGLAMPASALSLKWDDVSGSTVNFGKSYKGGGPSKLNLLATPSLDNSKPIARFGYYNAINKKKCFLFFCKGTPTQNRNFKIYEGSKLLTSVTVHVNPKTNPASDFFRFTVSYLADGYRWAGTKQRNVCEKCWHFLNLYGPNLVSPEPPVPPVEPPVAPVPLPASAFMLLIGVAALFRARRRAI